VADVVSAADEAGSGRVFAPGEQPAEASAMASAPLSSKRFGMDPPLERLESWTARRRRVLAARLAAPIRA
jgi:hypothetical protein